MRPLPKDIHFKIYQYLSYQDILNWYLAIEKSMPQTVLKILNQKIIDFNKRQHRNCHKCICDYAVNQCIDCGCKFDIDCGYCCWVGDHDDPNNRFYCIDCVYQCQHCQIISTNNFSECSFCHKEFCQHRIGHCDSCKGVQCLKCTWEPYMAPSFVTYVCPKEECRKGCRN